MQKVKTVQLNIQDRAAAIFFNVYNNGKVKVVWRWNDRTETKYLSRWMSKPQAREIYRTRNHLNQKAS